FSRTSTHPHHGHKPHNSTSASVRFESFQRPQNLKPLPLPRKHIHALLLQQP
ncbi:unnamed protein product, partial [Ceratitis capitata]